MKSMKDKRDGMRGRVEMRERRGGREGDGQSVYSTKVGIACHAMQLTGTIG